MAKVLEFSIIPSKISGSLSCGAREVRSPFAWRGGAHDGVITHLEPDILECEVKWALGSLTMNKASGGTVSFHSNPKERQSKRMLKLPTQWHHQLNGHEFKQALGVGDGQA